MKNLRSILFACVLVVAGTVGFLFGHGDVKAFSLGGSLTDLAASAKKGIQCPGGSYPKCVQCWGNDCGWSCRGGFYCYYGTTGQCFASGVSCGKSLALFSGYDTGWY